ncbi:[acyl-carrier-protein] S-malonyltransferase [Peptoniphilus asaccharolyticus DSM 20463]|uniref:Malonyl CoA-acyl carrier protein transacylase n=1 Tax=Peptoniphilus asaccharolyticus DSM 20463 TaxID=573058 RepID=A0A1W1UX23_PEPAS|nr:ACP S-malonyltransferase [Peptoniphilus asaccharolyticus]MBL7575306.1 ACP S-malonyltransferase [Peptoniphilus asaccharolyticus]SMB85715.1 [acyl-carrier-protein] S-malonyltransferase [Peptoniphilus asaccharolyticus DSM 20463]
MSKTALVFGGQGSQYSGMGLELFEKYPVVSDIYGVLGENLKEISFHGEIEEISKTENLQPIMVAFQLSTIKLLEKEIKIDATCGLSLGEYSALVASGVIDNKDAIELVKSRGMEMQKASDSIESAMVAVLNASEEYLREIVEKDTLKGKVFIANINSSKQIVISGEKESIEKLRDILKADGIKAIHLKVSGAFHTPFMESANLNYVKSLQKVDFKEPKLDYYPNLTGEKYAGEKMVELLCKQIVSPVLLFKTLKNMVDDGVDKFIEIGPGNVISSIIKKEFKDVTVETLKNDKEIINYIER